MAVMIVRLGSKRAPREGLRIGTVRKPPRGVPRARFAADDWYDVWFPNLAPSVPTMKLGLSATSDKQTTAFARRYRSEMAKPEASRALDLLAALSHHADFSVGCYCADESRCHRHVLRALLRERNAKLSGGADNSRSPRPLTRA
jgi:uncharacterized protein YeaO (DUF488 family)